MNDTIWQQQQQQLNTINTTTKKRNIKVMKLNK